MNEDQIYRFRREGLKRVKKYTAEESNLYNENRIGAKTKR